MWCRRLDVVQQHGGKTANSCVPEQCESAMKGEGDCVARRPLIFMSLPINACQRWRALLIMCIQLVCLSAVARWEPCLLTFDERVSIDKDATSKITWLSSHSWVGAHRMCCSTVAHSPSLGAGGRVAAFQHRSMTAQSTSTPP